MKITWFLIISTMISSLSAMGLENSTDTWYERMKKSGQERLGSAWTLAQEKGRAGIQYAQERTAQFRTWVAHNKKTIGAITVILLALVAATRTLNPTYRAQILQVFKDAGMKMKDDATKNYCFAIGSYVNIYGIEELQATFEKKSNKTIFQQYLKQPGFAAAVAKLAGVNEQLLYSIAI